MLSKIADAVRGLWPQSPESSTPLKPLEAPKFANPWDDRTLSPPDRYESYLTVAREHVSRIVAASKRDGITEEERTELRLSPDTQFWKGELEQLRKETPEGFCSRIDVPVILGKNFLGAASWKVGFGVDVGLVPPIPKEVTQSLLESPCPLHPGQKIKDTHILMLVPKTVNGEAYTALKLDELCATRKGSGDRLIYDKRERATAWKSTSWANAPQAQSEWVLLPKSDPDPNVSPEKHFRRKDITAQQKVHEAHYSEYREVKALEVMTMALLNDVVNGEPRILDGLNYLRCIEQNASGGRVCVGYFHVSGVGFFHVGGLEVCDDNRVSVNAEIGWSLARKLKT